MRTKLSTPGLVIFLLLFVFKTRAQSVEQATLNIGGGSHTAGNLLMDWSVGEGAAIQTFEGSNIVITAGVLQPFTGKTSLFDDITLPWFKDEIAIFPVPTHNILDVDIKIIQNGQVTMQLFDQRGFVLQTRTFEYLGTNRIQKINMTNLTAGVYYLNVTFVQKPVPLPIRKSTFKIQKL